MKKRFHLTKNLFELEQLNACEVFQNRDFVVRITIIDSRNQCATASDAISLWNTTVKVQALGQVLTKLFGVKSYQSTIDLFNVVREFTQLLIRCLSFMVF